MNQPDPKLELLMSREKLMEDIVNIMEENFDAIENRDGVIKELCDAVCNNFPL
tara:strand:- start:222 stop:380 length:159 start_codon:yes stop_codon:yes gene_type:complete